MMDFLADYFNMSNALYLVILILGAVLTLITKKYRGIVAEIKEVFETIREADRDGKRTEAEKEKIMREVLDVLKELLKLVWSPFKFKVKK